jgi:SAM-dependent methyltransferase
MTAQDSATQEATLVRRFFPESEIDNFSNISGTVQFYLKVKALYGDANPRVLDFGAGRGAWVELETSRTVRSLRDLRNGAREVVAADVDPAVLDNRCSHSQIVFDPRAALPFADNSFDLIVADFVFEHIEEPQRVADELLRILRPGGWICARTANKYGYVAIGSRLIPNRRHVRSLHAIQPARLEQDVFPTAYRLNTPRQIARHFAGHKLIYYRNSAEPSYHFNRSWIYRLFLVLHRLLPDQFATGLCVFVQK